MNNIELYTKLPNDLNFTRLDLYGDETISLTRVIQDVKDPAKVFSDFSKTFSIPASKTNNKFFKHYENFTQSSTFSFDARKRVSAKIELNSLPFQKGTVRLEGVDLKNGTANEYKITFFGEQNLKGILGELKLKDLDWLSNFDTSYTSTKIIDGLSSDGTGSVTVDSVAYPAPLVTALIGNSMRGYYSSSNTPAYFDNTKQEINKAGGNLNPSQATAYSGYYWKDLTFSIRLYVIIKAIENSDITGGLIKFSDDFFNTTNVGFYNLYMLCQRNAGKVLEGFGDSYTPNQQSNKGYINATIAEDHEEILTLTNTTINPTGLTTGQLFQFRLIITFPTATKTIFVDLYEVNSNRLETTFTYTTTQSGGSRTYQIGNGTYKLVFRCEVQQTVTSFSILLIDTFATNSTTSIATGDLDVDFIIPSGAFTVQNSIPDMKVLDFLSGLFKMFNLTATTKNGLTTIDTLNSFYTGGTLRDITEFVDNTTKIVDKALPYRSINFRYEDTGNILAKQHNEQFQSDWGSVSYDDDGTLDSNNNTYEVIAPFQHMKFERLYDGSTIKNIQVGHLLDDKQEAYLGKPLLFYPIHTTEIPSPTSFNLVTEISGYDAGSSPAESTQSAYWIPSNTPALLNNDTGYPETIHFGLEVNEWNAPDTTWTDSLFEKYYKSYIVNVFRSNERLTKIKAKLPLKFLQNYNLADEVQINDLTYRINTITTNLQTGESSLELLNGRETVAATGSGTVSTTISSTNNANASTACGLTLNTTVYYSGSLGNTTRLFTTNGLSTAYSGSGNYHRFPSNYYGTIDSNGYISNYNPCPTLSPTVTTSTTTSITYQAFTANGSLNVANGTVSARGFYIGTNSTYTNNPKQVVSGTSTGSFSYTKSSGVLAGVTYYVTAYATNGNGTGVGSTVSFATSAAPNVPTVTAQAETNIAETSFTANLNISNDGGQTINGAGFYMGTNNSSATANTHYDISPAPTSIGNKSRAFTGLSASTTYYYWGTATNTYSATKGVSSSYETVVTSAAATAPSVATQTESSVTATSFTGNINITADNGASITGAAIWMGTNNSAYNATGNTQYSISTTSTGVISNNFTSLTPNTAYYYWASATNSAGTTISSSYETVNTPLQVYSYNAHYNTSAFTACVQSLSATYYSYTSTWQVGMVLYTTNTNSVLSGLAANGNYRLNPNKYHIISGGNGTLGSEQSCNLNVYRLKITADYVSGTNFYDITTVFGKSFSTTDYLYKAGGAFSSGSLVYADENLTTTPTYGLGTFKTLHTYPQDYKYQLYPDQAFFAAKMQTFNTSTQQWVDHAGGRYTRFYQMDSSGYIEPVYWNYGNGDLYYDSVNPSTAGLSGIKISSSGSSDATTACSTTPSTIVYYDETTLGNNTVLYTDSRDAGASTANNKFNGGGNWYKFENNYRAQISSTGVVSNYASC